MILHSIMYHVGYDDQVAIFSCDCHQAASDSAKHMTHAFSDVIGGQNLASDERWREVLNVRDLLDLFLSQVRYVIVSSILGLYIHLL